MYCTLCAIYSTVALTHAWQMIGECDFGFIVWQELAPLVCVAMCTRASPYAARPQRINSQDELIPMCSEARLYKLA